MDEKETETRTTFFFCGRVSTFFFSSFLGWFDEVVCPRAQNRNIPYDLESNAVSSSLIVPNEW